MTVRRIPVRNAMSNEQELLEGEVIDVLPNDNSVYVDGSGKTYDATKGVRMSELPQSGVIQLPRTTWYAIDPDDLAVVSYLKWSREVRSDLRTEDPCVRHEPPFTR